MEERLQQLRTEYEEGLRQMARLDERRRDLQQTLLRISGAIQVLEELIARERTVEVGDEGHVRPTSAGAAGR